MRDVTLHLARATGLGKYSMVERIKECLPGLECALDRELGPERAEVQPFNLPIDGPITAYRPWGRLSSSIGPLWATARFLEQGKHGTSQRTLT